jgi:hypothetical protein
MLRSPILRGLFFLSIFALAAPALLAQQTGAISGTVTSDGQPLPGVTVEARSNVLPQPRVTTTSANGDYRLPALPVGRYTVTYSLSGMQGQTRNVEVYLGGDANVNVSLGVEAVAETITVTADSPLIDPTSTEVRSEVSEEMIEQVPVGQEYRDLLKLAPAVQYTEDIIRGPSAGGSGQDNTYMFDGVNVTLPLYGTLSAEPSSHDIDQVTVVKGGAKAVDFNRAAGFTIDSVSKSGTNEWMGELKYQLQNSDFTSDQDFAVQSVYDQDRDWLTAAIGGPILRDRLFVYGSYYRPTTSQGNASNVYGEYPGLESERNEFFGKLTFTPTQNILLHGSYRDSERDVANANIEATEAATGSVTETSGLEIGIVEGSWVLTPRSFLTFKFNDYANLTSAIADLPSSAVPSRTVGTVIDINNLDQFGRFVVPSARANNPTYTQRVQPFIDRYGYNNSSGVRTGGGFVGGDPEAVDNIDFFRQSYELNYDITLGSAVSHDLHVGYQRFEDAEELLRSSNGWGIIDAASANTVNCPSDATECAGQPFFLHAEFLRSFAGIGSGLIRSEFHSDNIEINDTIRWGDWSFNAGLLFSNDKLYGQGLREDENALSGYVSAPGNRYLMYEIPWEKQIQPRFGVTWAYNSRDTVYASYAKYNPSVSSLPRAASWDRNAFSQLIDVYFDDQGRVIGSRERGGSSGKLFVEDLDPRYTDEYLIGTSRQFGQAFTARAYGRYRYSTNFWEDTNNNARIAFNPPEGIPREYYIENLGQMLTQIGTGGSQNSYVIAELDGAFTKYWEATVESDYRIGNAFFRGTYTWSHYYGNFDQDNTSLTNDLSIFVGSSNIADSAGRQLWDNKYGNLRADRRHLLKAYGFYSLPWRATVGAFGVYQSGHAWEAWSYVPYQSLTSSTSSTNRYAEPAGSRTTPAHYQIDVNYTQNIPVSALNVQLIADLYNLLDNQTGYNPEPALTSANFGNFRSHYSPRRFQLAVRLQF